MQGNSDQNNTPLDSFTIEIGEVEHNQRIIKWIKKEGKDTNAERYVLDDQWSTVRWEVSDTKEALQYSARRDGNNLFINGKLKNKDLVKEIKIDSDPFYFNPKLGLRHLIESGKTSQTFWAMRHDNLDVFKMRAMNKGVETISIQGKEVMAIRIEWAALSGFSKYFNRTYWFRQSDGVYLKQKVMGSKVRALVNER